jgi:hypothetical protein
LQQMLFDAAESLSGDPSLAAPRTSLADDYA